MTSNDPELLDHASTWTFLTNHAHVLICIAGRSDIRLSEVADQVGIGERAVHRIVHELEAAGYLTVVKEGRRNLYEIDLDRPLRHPLESHQHVRAIVAPIVEGIADTAGGDA
jgi:DNA-binding IclR family transcriptional regulator